MKGLDVSRQYFNELVLPMLKEKLPNLLDKVTAGLVGHGSECFGYDDGISADHDYGPGCCLWLSGEDYAVYGFKLERAYAALPKSFMGSTEVSRSALGSGSRGVKSIPEFYRLYTGRGGAPEGLKDWLYIPSCYLAEAVNGEVFYAGNDCFTSIRNTILNGMPEDCRLKRMAAHAALAAQSGQYNYSRCLSHGEPGAAGIAVAEFVKHASELIFLLNRRYMPYYKWMFRSLKALPKLSDMGEPLEFLLTADNTDKGTELKAEIIEDIASAIIKELKLQGLTEVGDNYLEPHAFELMKRISSPEIRSLHVMDC